MAELSKRAACAVLGTFLPAFNKEHHSAHVVSTGPNNDTSCDYLCQDPARPRERLKLQLTRVSMRVETLPVGWSNRGAADACLDQPP